VPKYGADYLRRLDAAVVQFQTAFDAWTATQLERSHREARGMLPTISPKAGHDEAELRRLELDVAEAAGMAANAIVVTGAHINIEGYPPLDPIANWSTLSAPRSLFEPREVRLAAATARGRLRTMIDETEAAQDSAVPAFAPSAFHPVIWSAAAAHWTNHQYREAVRNGAEALTEHWRKQLGRMDVNGTKFWAETLAMPKTQGPKSVPIRPRLVWPGDASDQTVSSMRNGLKGLAEGLTATVRNPTTHTTDELSEQNAMERLAAYSVLAGLLDQCEVVWPEDSSNAAPQV
jgi:hypothetical protein